MPISKNRKDHKNNLLNYKNKQKQMEKQMQQVPQMPPVRSIPIWTNDAKIELTGYEWEAIQNGLTQIQIAQQAGQAIMSRHLINGVIGMDFEKLNPTTLQYEPMTDEEKKPHQENFAKAIDAIKNPKPAEKPLISDAEVVEDNEAPKVEAKIITMDTKA